VSWQLFLGTRRRLFDSFDGEQSAPVRAIQADRVVQLDDLATLEVSARIGMVGGHELGIRTSVEARPDKHARDGTRATAAHAEDDDAARSIRARVPDHRRPRLPVASSRSSAMSSATG
jgi:hypothetical protein